MKAGRMSRGGKGVLAVVAAACVVCCAGPLLAFLAAIGVASAVAAVFLPALAVVAVGAGGGIWWLRQRSRTHCETPAGVVSLAMPTLRPVEVARDGRPSRQ